MKSKMQSEQKYRWRQLPSWISNTPFNENVYVAISIVNNYVTSKKRSELS